MTDPVPDSAVEAAYGYLPGIPSSYDLMLRKATTRAMLTAAAPHIAAQATADLRTGIEALRDEWHIAGDGTSNEGRAFRHCADTLDALLRGAK